MVSRWGSVEVEQPLCHRGTFDLANAGVANNIINCCIAATTAGTEPSLRLLVPPVLFLLRQVKLSAVKKVYESDSFWHDKKTQEATLSWLTGTLDGIVSSHIWVFPTIASQNVYSELVYCQHVKYLYVISNSNLTCKIRHNVTITYEIDLNQHT